jgi:fibronectin-binding autotransporter adhesin
MNILDRRHHRRFLLLQVAAIGLLAGPSVHAATIDWAGGTSTAWATGGNWAGGTAPVDDLTTDIANFNLATYGGNPVFAPNAGTRSISGITIGATNGPMTLTTTSLSIGGSGISIASGAGTLTISGSISGTGGLTKQNADSLTLSGGTNTYSGATTVSAGRMLLNSADALSPSTAVTVSGSNAQLFFQPSAGNKPYNNAMTISGMGFAEADGTRVGAIRLSSGVNLGGTLTLPADARVGIIGTNTVTLSGQVTGPGGLEFYGVNNANGAAITFNLSNTGNDYAGTTTISSKDLSSPRTNATATLKLGASGVIPDGAGKGIVSFTGADANHLTILDLNGFNETVNGLSNTSAAGARITNAAAGTAVLTVGAGDTTSSFSGVITQAGSGAILALSKTGTGTLTLSGSNSYGGVTTVSAGTLKLDVAGAVGASSGVSIASGASLDLSAIAGGFTLGSGQSLGGAGSILGDLVFGDGSKLVFSTNDTLAMSGGTASFFAGTPGSRFGIDDLLGISSSTPLGTYTLISGTVNTTNLDNLGAANAFNLGSGVSAYFQQGSLQVVVVPEPGVLALAAAGLAGVAWAVTRRRRRGAA